MWVRNKNTGHEWFVSEEHGEQLLKEDYYESFEPETDLKTLTVPQLKELATERGIDFPSDIKKDDLIALFQ